MSELEEAFAGQLRYLFMDRGWDQDAIVREYQFHPERKWRADFMIEGLHRTPDLLIEIDGGTRSYGRHNRHEGFRNDCEKINAAVLLGYQVLRFTSDMVNDGSAIATVERALTGDTEGDDDA